MELLKTRKEINEKWGCGCALINKENKVLMGLRCKKTDKREWCLVGGSIEVGETPAEGVMREIKEESNLDANSIDFVDYFKIGEYLDFLFVCRDFEGEEKPQPGEFSELRWFSREDLEDENITIYPCTIDSLKILKEKNVF